MSLESAVVGLKALSIPAERPAVSTNALLGIIAAKYLETTSSSLETFGSFSSEEPWWSYAMCCLDCLDKLCDAVKAHKDDTPALSAHQMSLLRDRLEFVVALGLAPHLDPGVGLPISARICSAEQFLQPRQGFHAERVRLIVERLMALYEAAELRVALLPKFLHDLLVGLMSLSFAPKSEPKLRPRFQARLRHVTTSGLPGRREIVREVFVIQGASGHQKSSLTPAPAWLRFACSQILSKQIEKSPDGVLPLVLGFFDFAGRHGREAEKCRTLATILTRPPKNAAAEQLSEHWRNVCSQILSCLQSHPDPLILRFAVAFTVGFASSYPSVARELLLDPFFCFSDTSGPMSADDLELLFIRLERFVVNCFDPDPAICSLLLRHFDLLFFAFAAAAQELPCRASVLASLCSLLKLREAPHAMENWAALLLDSPRNSDRRFLRTADGRLTLEGGRRELGPSARFGVAEEQVAEAVVTVLEQLPSDYQGLLFIELLRRLRLFVMREVESEAVVITPSLRSEDQPRPDLLMALLTLIAEKFPECCLERPEMIVELAKETVARCLFVANNTEEDATQLFTTEAISISLSLFSSVLMSREGLREDGKACVTAALDSSLPVISDLKERHPSEALRQLAADLLVAMATRGYVISEAVNAAAAATGGGVARPLVEEVEAEEIGGALRDAGDSEVPVRGHGLLVLARAVEAKRSEVGEHHEKMLQLFIDGVTHEDSFVYLPAIRGLAAMASTRPARLLPLLLREFADSRLDGEVGGDQRAEFRLKVGEAIVRCVRALGQAAVQHRDQLLNVLLSRCRLEGRDLLRAAALSNLAEVCRLLRFALHTCLHEVLAAAAALLATDRSAAVRKAAAFLLLSLLRGADRQLLAICGGEGLKETFRALRRSAAAEKDEGVHRMVLLACNELDDLVRAQIFPEQGKMEKHIRIL